MMEYCRCKKFKEEVKRATAIIYNEHYKAYYIQDVERGACPHEYKIGNIKIDRCPWCGKKLEEK